MSGTLPALISLNSSRRPTFLEVALEARRALTNATNDAAVADAAARMAVQLHGLNECIAGMAETGLLNIDISVDELVTQTSRVNGEWHSRTRAPRLPPRVCQDTRLNPAICNHVMQSLVVFSAVERDPLGELVEMRQLAGILADDWPDLSTEEQKKFEASLRAAWESNHAPGSSSDSTDRLSRALSEKLHGAAHAAGGGDASGCDSALAYARRTLTKISER